MCLHVDVEEHELRDLDEPANYKDALLDPEYKKWLNAMHVEMQSMKDNKVWDLVDLPPNGKTVGSKWLFKKKTDMDDITAIMILIAIVAFYDYEIWQMDVKTFFLNGHLFEEVYMVLLEVFVNPKFLNRVCKLKHSIYGLKQASGKWNKEFDDEINKFDFSQNRDEPCVYMKASESYVTFRILYADDILIMENNILMLQDVKSYLGRCFAMKDLGEATGCVFVLNGGVVDWKSSKQSIFATSYTEAEYIAAYDASKEAVWIQKFIFRLGDVRTLIMEEAHAMKYSVRPEVVRCSVILGIVRFGKKGELAPRYVGPLEILERIGPVAYQLRIPDELSIGNYLGPIVVRHESEKTAWPIMLRHAYVKMA
nr:hypothetical protein [Tanacetum cinerariifolium]